MDGPVVGVALHQDGVVDRLEDPRQVTQDPGRLDPEDPRSLGEFIERIAKTLGWEKERVRSVLEREARLYSLLDHTKTLAFMLADGIVPSNQGEGYLARLLIRRSLKNLHLLGSGVGLRELVSLQIGYWSRDFPHLEERRGYILDAIGLEEERYRQLLKEQLPRAVKMLRRNPSIETLVRIYQELGLPPEVVVEEARKQGLEGVDVPPNFYAFIAREGQAPKPAGVEEKPEWIEGLPETRRIFHEDPYARETEARVLRVVGRGVVLDQTVAYPTGGGQIHDTGELAWDGGRARIVDVRMHDGVIEHVLDREPEGLVEGARVRVSIDWERRYRIMRHHTATHIMLGALRRVLGPHVWQAGAEKTPEKGRLDITHYKPISPEEQARVEELANSIVLDRRPVLVREEDRNEAEEKYGFTIYQGGVPLQPRIRIVEIPGHDTEACFGTHVANTGDVGGIKITGITKLQDGVYRVEYTAGTQVAQYSAELERALRQASQALGGGPRDVPRRAESLAREMEKQKALLSRYRRQLEGVLIGQLVQTARDAGGARLSVYVDEIGDSKLSTEVLKKAVEKDPRLIVVRIQPGKPTVVEISAGREAAKKAPATQVAQALSRIAPGKGGGSPTHAFWRTAGGIDPREVEELLVKTLEEKRG